MKEKTKINKKFARNNIKNSEKAITLIALVVTIIVLIILAGISISLVLGDNGIITKARDARSNFIKSANEEQTGLDNLYAEMNEKISGTSNPGGAGGQGGGNTGIDITTLWPTDGSTKPYLPDEIKFHVSEKEGENTLADGLVIVDDQNNEYVWIEVPRTNAVYGDILTNYPAITDANRETALPLIKAALITYAGFGNEGEGSDSKTTRRGWKDEYYDGCEIEAANGKTAQENYNALYNTMLESVYTNGGFYIGRYEAGVATIRNKSTEGVDGSNYKTTSIPNDLKPLSQANKYPLNWITCSQAQTIATRAETGTRTSSLMFGLQWDLVIKYLETKGIATADLKSDSKKVGNYYNSSYSITTDTDVEYSSDYGETYTKVEDVTLDHTSSKYMLLTTGADTDEISTNAKFDMKNIYDLAGNVWEWTLEHATSDGSFPCASRGGSYYSNGDRYPASGRSGNGATASRSFIGFRVSLY